MKYSIKKKISFSFYLLASIFVINGIVVFWTIDHNKRLSQQVSESIDPSVEALNDYKLMLILSREFSINWVYLRSNEEYKNVLREIHSAKYPALRKKLSVEALRWENAKNRDELAGIFNEFDKVIGQEKEVMNLLSRFEDYDDLVKKLTAESVLENNVIPQTDVLLKKLDHVIDEENIVKANAEQKQESAFMMMRSVIIFLAIAIIIAVILLAGYMMKVIIKPINKIVEIVNDLGRGVIRNTISHDSKDEIGEMTNAVNALSGKLNSAALFAVDVGNRNFDSDFVPLSDEDNLGKALITMRDSLRLSDHNLNEARNKLLTQNSELMKTNSELDKFVYSVSHDLRAPLSSMAGVVDIVLDEEADPFIQENLTMIKGSIKKLDGFILDILDYSRNSRVEVSKEQVDPSEMLNDIKTNLKYMGKNQRDVRIETEVKCSVPVYSDRSRLSIILSNLISNAIRYSDPKSNDPFVKVNVESDNNSTVIVVKDNGIGINKELHGKVFDMFYRVSKESVGSGLGLYIVKECISKLMGQIYIVSEPGRGTEFHVKLPNRCA